MATYKYLAFIALVVAFATCNKKSSTEITLNGKWELMYVEGGWVGHRNYERGNGNTLTFQNSSYSRTVHYDDTTYKESGTFSVFKAKPCESADEKTLLKFDSIEMLNVLDLSATTLTIGPSPTCIIDAGTATYRKLIP